MEWLANWCFVRGQNLLYPHAFYYSVRGPRRDERPPDVGPNAAWWPKYRPYADACRRLSWLNTDSRQVCQVAVLADATYLPQRAAKVCFQHQRDFNYLELRHLWDDAKVEADGVHLAGMHYRAVILDELGPLPKEAAAALERLVASGRLVVWGRTPLKGATRVKTAEQLAAAIDRLIGPDLSLVPASFDIRYRHVVKREQHFYILFNEGPETVTAKLSVATAGKRRWLDPRSAEVTNAAGDPPITLGPHELRILAVGP